MPMELIRDPRSEMIDDILANSIDMHVHTSMMSGYRWNLVELAQKAVEAKMTGIVLKNYYGLCSEAAYLVNHIVGHEIFIGSIVLNRWCGGLNAVAVKEFLSYGSGVKVVWMPTRHALHALKLGKQDLSLAVHLFDGKEIRPELHDVLTLIAEHNAVLSTGHISPEESILLIKAAKKIGVKNVIVNHCNCLPSVATLDEQKEMIKAGALVEQCMSVFMPIHTLKTIKRFGTVEGFNIAQNIQNIVDLGVENCVVSTDFGQDYNPLSVDGLRTFIRALLEYKLTPEQIKTMVQHNPKKLLGIKGNAYIHGNNFEVKPGE